MRNIWILFKKELMGFFLSPIAYIVGVCFLAITGFSFYTVVVLLSESSSEYQPVQIFLSGFFSWICLLVVTPVITMRLFAAEKQSGTIESMMTTPVRDLEYVLAKFFGAYFFFVLLWLATAHCVYVLRHFAKDATPLDLGPVIGGYMGILLVGALFVSIGCMASAMTKNQIIAAVVTFALTGGLFFGGLFFYLNAADKHRDFFESFSMLAHVQEMATGLVDWRRIVFYVTGTCFFLFLTHRIVQARHWKS